MSVVVEGGRKTAQREHLAGLDALRGLCALCVAIYHFSISTSAFSGKWREAVVIVGVYAVQVFFLISGVCFFHLYARPDAPKAWGSYFVRRFFRIAPLYYLGMLLSLFDARPIHRALTPKLVIENLTLSFGAFHPNHSMLSGGWSIGVEWLFYLLLPLIVWLLRTPWLRALGAALLVAIAVQYNLSVLDVAANAQRFHAYVAFANHAFLFVVGGLIVDARRSTSLRLPAWVVVLPTLTFVLAVRLGPSFHDHMLIVMDSRRVWYTLLSVFCVFVVALLRPSHTRPARALAALGELSYSIYLMHPFVWRHLSSRLEPIASPELRLTTAVAITLGLAFVTHRLLEQPLLRVGRRLSHRPPFRSRQSVLVTP